MLAKKNYIIISLFLITLLSIILLNSFTQPQNNSAELVESKTMEQNLSIQATIAAKPALGNDIGGLAYFSTQWVFVDLMKQGSEWITQNITPGGPWNTGMIDQIPLDENGYPLELPFIAPDGTPQRVVTLTGNPSYPSGDYILLFDGEGEIEIFGRNLSYQQEGPGRYRITRTDGDRINIAITKSVKGNHVRNMRLIMPGFEDNYEQQIFHPLFLERLQPFAVLRFMNLMEANNNKLITWEDRTKTDTYTQARRGYGMAPEYIPQLANRTEADIWINMPHQADDNYIRELATLLKQELNPDKKIYVEYSNEVWNAQFQQTQWLYQVGCENPDTFVKDESNQAQTIPGCNHFLSSINFHVQRLARIAEIFAEVFQENFEDRIIIVAASQGVNPYLSEQILERFSNPKLNPQGYKPAALAVAPYFGFRADRKEQVNENITVDELLDLAQEHIETKVLEFALQHKQIADKYNVALIAYEGGQHLVPRPAQRETPLTQTMIEANRHPRMGDLYREYLKNWFDTVGGGAFANFSNVGTPSHFGSWGVLEYQDQAISEAPKYQALLDIIDYLQQKSAS